MILDKPYNKDSFIDFTKDFLIDYTHDERPTRVSDSSILSSVIQLGISRELNLTVFDVECEDGDSNRRIAITQAAFKVLRDHGIRNALIAFHNSSNQWRLSLLTSTLELINGKIVKKDSSPRRYSYLLGVGAKTRTPHKFLIEKGRVLDLGSLQERFSAEVVNKQFYDSVAELFTKLVGGERDRKKYPGILKIEDKISQDNSHQEFAVRLIGRLVFCWFLREKCSPNGTSLIPDSILSAKAAQKSMYYHSVLEPLFFELLNTNQRKESFKVWPYNLIPYLNGGLFSPLKGENGDHYEYSEVTNGGIGAVDVPDEWLREFTELLDKYNFTVDENTSYDIDLSVDPEMLGRIFENLLAEINPDTGESARKSTGSFYTPREIVEYMVDRSIVHFLENKTEVSTEKLEALISYNLDDDTKYPLTPEDNNQVVNALSDLTILDPACGSGAFPIGALQKIVYVLQQVDKDSKYWLEQQTNNISPELRRHLEDQYKNGNFDYLRKLGVIRKSIFGVDIQSIATEVARLRCFLTLIVEEEVSDSVEENRGIQPLPNLDFKFVTADSLINLPDDKNRTVKNQDSFFEDTSHINDLKKIRDNYFGANPEERGLLQSNFHNLQTDMVIKNMDEYKGSASRRYNALSRWKPFEHKKVDWFDPDWMFGIKQFDIIIANPPYLGEKGHKELFQNIREDGLKKYYMGKMDLFYFFFHHALNLASEGGIVSFITTNYFTTATGAKKLREDISKRSIIKELINFNELKIFESALGQHNMISILEKNTKTIKNYEALAIVTHQKGYHGKMMLESIVNGHDSKTEYHRIPQNKLFSNGYIKLTSGGVDNILEKIANSSDQLGKVSIIFSGVDVTLNQITPKIAKDFSLSDQEIGSGVFVVDKGCALKSSHLVDYIKNSDIKKYSPLVTNKSLLYINWHDNPEEQVIEYLLPYKKILDDQIKRFGESYPWYAIHRPRKKHLFIEDKIVTPYRTNALNFTMSSKSEFFGRDVYAIAKSKYDLNYLLGLLNSRVIEFWLKLRGKRKGDILEIMSKPLSEIPIPRLEGAKDHEIADKIASLVADILSIKQIDQKTSTGDIEVEINQLAYSLYRLTPEEITLIETV